MKLRKPLEPALGRELTGEVFRKAPLFGLCGRPGASTGQSCGVSKPRALSGCSCPSSSSGERGFLSAPAWLPVSAWAPRHAPGDFSASSLMDQSCSLQPSPPPPI